MSDAFWTNLAAIIGALTILFGQAISYWKSRKDKQEIIGEVKVNTDVTLKQGELTTKKVESAVQGAHQQAVDVVGQVVTETKMAAALAAEKVAMVAKQATAATQQALGAVAQKLDDQNTAINGRLSERIQVERNDAYKTGQLDTLGDRITILEKGHAELKAGHEEIKTGLGEVLTLLKNKR